MQNSYPRISNFNHYEKSFSITSFISIYWWTGFIQHMEKREEEEEKIKQNKINETFFIIRPLANNSDSDVSPKRTCTFEVNLLFYCVFG